MIYPEKIKKVLRLELFVCQMECLGSFVKHEVKLIEERLPRDFGLKFKYMPNALKGEEFLKNHPEKKAEDLKSAFLDEEVDIIWSALGGDDTFRTLPYLMNDEFAEIIKKHPKPFLGFSDTINNHLMLYQLGLATFYAPSLLSDVAEFGPEIFTYTKDWLNKLFDSEKNIAIKSSPVWYEARTSFDESQLGAWRKEQKEEHGHEYLYGKGVVQGDLLGGCLESLSEMITGGRHPDQKEVYEKYQIFPTREQWGGKIAFIETSEERPNPEKVCCRY